MKSAHVVLLVLLVAACRQTPPEAEFLWSLPSSEWDSALAELPPSDQMVVFRYGILDVEPSIHLEAELARLGEDVLPLVLEEMQGVDQEHYLLALVRLTAMVRCDEGVHFQEDEIDTIADALSRIRSPQRMASVRYNYERVVEGNCDAVPPDAADLIRE